MKIYVNAKLGAEARERLRRGVEGHELHLGAPTEILERGAVDAALDGAEVALGQPDPEALIASTTLHLVQLTSAGWTRYDRDDLRAALRARDTALCSASQVFAVPVAEHAVAMILGLARRLPEALTEQAGARGWPMNALRAGSRVLGGERVLLLGYGAIARALAARLRPFGVELVGYRRRLRGDEEIAMVDRTGLDAALAAADHVVDLLPEGIESQRFCDASFFARCRRGARFYNLGRGATVDQDALIATLRSGHLDAAWLDVTTPEPLPVDHPLWSTPRLYVSPHTAGGQGPGEDDALVAQFLANLAAFAAGRPLLDRVV